MGQEDNFGYHRRIRRSLPWRGVRAYLLSMPTLTGYQVIWRGNTDLANTRKKNSGTVFFY